jgi:tetratricopeptide (TPR) repeat protein
MIDLQIGNSQEHRMKKLVFATAMALVSMALASAPALRAQGSNEGTISIQNPAEFNAYQTAVTQSNPSAKAAALESFLRAYPKSVAKEAVLVDLIQTYQSLNEPDKALSAASRLLEVDPDNMRAIYISVYIEMNQCTQSVDPSTGVSKNPQVCDHAADLAQKGLGLSKPADTPDDAWKKMTDATYPIFHSAIALDDAAAKKDDSAAIAEYRKALMLYPADATKSGPGLVDTLHLAEAYAKPKSKNEVLACWFYARAWNFAPPAYKAQIEPKLEYWYKQYHGSLDGLNDVKTAAAQSLFPPADFKITPAATPAQIADKVVNETPDLTKLNLEDKEFILANGSPADQQKLWSVLQGQLTPVPGNVISDPADVLNVEVTTTRSVKPQDFVVHLTTPQACSAVPPPPADTKIADAQQYILSNGVQADTSAMGDLLTSTAGIRKIVIEPAVSTINMAVTQDAKDNNTPDFIVNMKTPVSCKDAPAPGFQMKTLPAEELDATYDSYKPIAATSTRLATAQIVLGGGFIQKQPPKTPARRPVARRPVRR